MRRSLSCKTAVGTYLAAGIFVEVKRIAGVVKTSFVTAIVAGIVAIVIVLVHHLITGSGALSHVRTKFRTCGANAGLIMR